MTEPHLGLSGNQGCAGASCALWDKVGTAAAAWAEPSCLGCSSSQTLMPVPIPHLGWALIWEGLCTWRRALWQILGCAGARRWCQGTRAPSVSANTGNLLCCSTVTSGGDLKVPSVGKRIHCCPPVAVLARDTLCDLTATAAEAAPPCSAPLVGHLASLQGETGASWGNLTGCLRREEDFTNTGIQNEWLTAWGSSSLNPVLGQGHGLCTPSPQSFPSGFTLFRILWPDWENPALDYLHWMIGMPR